MTTTESTALAVRDSLTDAQIQQRIKLHRAPGFGLERAAPAALNLLFLYCQKHQLLPGDDVTLYDGKPFLQISGVVKAMRRHPEYRGYACRPLNAADKEAWGYDAGDIVIECTIRTDRWGEISARGKVSKDEAAGVQRAGARLNPVARLHPVEMAEKRAIARAQRAAFGLDAVVDEEEFEQAAHTVITERNDPARIAAGAARYDEVIAPNYDEDLPIAISAAPEPQPVAAESEPADADLLQAARERNKEACDQAEAIGVKGVRQLRAQAADTLEDIERKTFEAEERTRSRNNEIDASMAAQSSGQAQAF